MLMLLLVDGMGGMNAAGWCMKFRDVTSFSVLRLLDGHVEEYSEEMDRRLSNRVTLPTT